MGAQRVPRSPLPDARLYWYYERPFNPELDTRNFAGYAPNSEQEKVSPWRVVAVAALAMLAVGLANRYAANSPIHSSTTPQPSATSEALNTSQ